MRKLISIMLVMAFCLVLTCPAFAAEGDFVPSISYKDGPDIIDAEMDDEDMKSCLIITSIKGAQEKTTDIYQSDRDLLLSVYQQLSDGSMVLPMEGTGSMARTGGATKKYYVIRELLDVSFKKTPCREGEHGHKEKLAEPGILITITFDLGVSADAKVLVLNYVDGKWDYIESVVNNGDGTLTCVFEDICPVVFCVENESKDPSQTGDIDKEKMILWFLLMAVSTAAIVVLAVARRKQTR